MPKSRSGRRFLTVLVIAVVLVGVWLFVAKPLSNRQTKVVVDQPITTKQEDKKTDKSGKSDGSTDKSGSESAGGSSGGSTGSAGASGGAGGTSGSGSSSASDSGSSLDMPSELTTTGPADSSGLTALLAGVVVYLALLGRSFKVKQ